MPFFYFIKFFHRDDGPAKRNAGTHSAGPAARDRDRELFGICLLNEIDKLFRILRDRNFVGYSVLKIGAVFEITFDDIGVGFGEHYLFGRDHADRLDLDLRDDLII